MFIYTECFRSNNTNYNSNKVVENMLKCIVNYRLIYRVKF